MMKPLRSKYFKSSYKALFLLDKPCLSFSQLKQIQSHLIVSGTIADPFAAGKLLAGFAISNTTNIKHAYTLFSVIPHRSTYIWNTMIRAFTENNQPTNAIFISKEMLKNGLLLNNYTFSFVFQACCELCDVSLGLMYHGLVVKLGWGNYDFVHNGLVHLYAGCEEMGLARKLFDASGTRDVVTWTAVLNGYVKCGDIGVARELFDQMPERNSVSWSTLINGYVRVGLCKEALELFNDMQVVGIQPNHAAIVGALSACASIGALDQGRWIHAFVSRSKIKIDRVLGTALIDMYSKSGLIDMACSVFAELPDRDVFTYTSLICGLANHGENGKALELFKRMGSEGIRPNEVTFIGVLNACKRMGLMQEGLMIFANLKQVHGIKPVIEHYGCLVDLLGRAGMLKQARTFFREMPVEPDSFVLGALLNACTVHGDTNLGEEIVKELSDQSLDHDGVYVLLSNMYAAVNSWDNVESVRKGMKEMTLKKVPGCSLIEVYGVISEFVAGDRSRVHIDGIDMISLIVNNHLKSCEEYQSDLDIEQFYS